jgi:putative pyruvate formate lyase activating enzyme
MNGCSICPRECGADRDIQKGACGCGKYPAVARAALHFWEEPCISGTKGSGAIFFSGCNLRCLFCQNMDISRNEKGRTFDPRGIADLMLRMQELGAHNVNLVTPAPHVPVLALSIAAAKKDGLRIPVVYNTNAYEKTETLRMLKGLVDIYLPDIKYVGSEASMKYSKAPDYFKYAAPAVMEMYDQCGTLELSDDGTAKKGVLIRHLVLPGSVDETRKVLDFISKNLPKDTAVSLMGQYTPIGPSLPPPLDRTLTKREYGRALEYCISIGLQNVFIQSKESCGSGFVPNFNGVYE